MSPLRDNGAKCPVRLLSFVRVPGASANKAINMSASVLLPNAFFKISASHEQGRNKK